MKKSSFYAVLMVTIGLFIGSVAIAENTANVSANGLNNTVNNFDPPLRLNSVADLNTVFVPE